MGKCLRWRGCHCGRGGVVRIRWATSAVHPVWCAAPRPMPVSPWKYSWNGILSFHRGSVASRLTSSCSRAVVHRPAAVQPGQENGHQPVGDVVRRRGQRPSFPGSGGKFHGHLPGRKPVVIAERLDQQDIERHPDRAAPIGVSAEQVGGGFRRLVIDRSRHAADLNTERVFTVPRRDRPDPVIG